MAPTLLLLLVVVVALVEGNAVELTKECPQECRDVDKTTSCGKLSNVKSCTTYRNGSVVMECFNECISYMIGTEGCRSWYRCGPARRAWDSIVRFFNLVADTYSGFSPGAKLFISVALMLTGTLLGFWGYALIEATTFISGFILGVVLGVAIAESQGMSPSSSQYLALIAVGAGFAMGTLMLLLLFVAVFLMGSSVAVALPAIILINTLPDDENTAGAPTVVVAVVSVVAFVAGGVAALRWQKHGIVLYSAFFGAGCVTQGLLYVSMHSTLLSAWHRSPSAALASVCLTVLTVTGVLVQLFVTGRKADRDFDGKPAYSAGILNLHRFIQRRKGYAEIEQPAPLERSASHASLQEAAVPRHHTPEVVPLSVRAFSTMVTPHRDSRLPSVGPGAVAAQRIAVGEVEVVNATVVAGSPAGAPKIDYSDDLQLQYAE